MIRVTPKKAASAITIIPEIASADLLSEDCAVAVGVANLSDEVSGLPAIGALTV